MSAGEKVDNCAEGFLGWSNTLLSLNNRRHAVKVVDCLGQCFLIMPPAKAQDTAGVPPAVQGLGGCTLSALSPRVCVVVGQPLGVHTCYYCVTMQQAPTCSCVSCSARLRNLTQGLRDVGRYLRCGRGCRHMYCLRSSSPVYKHSLLITHWIHTVWAGSISCQLTPC